MGKWIKGKGREKTERGDSDRETKVASCLLLYPLSLFPYPFIFF
jgi:hypothetical protein